VCTSSYYIYNINNKIYICMYGPSNMALNPWDLDPLDCT